MRRSKELQSIVERVDFLKTLGTFDIGEKTATAEKIFSEAVELLNDIEVRLSALEIQNGTDQGRDV